MKDGETGLGSARDHSRRLRRGVVTVVVLMLLVGGLLAAVPGLQDVTDRLKQVSAGWIVLAIVLELASCVGYVLAFQLVFYRAPLVFAARVAWSELGFGAVLPAGGAGGVALGAWILHMRGVPASRIADRSAVLFLLTSAINAAVLAGFGLAVAVGLLPPDGHPLLLGGVPAAAGIGVLAGFLAVPAAARRLGDRDGRLARSLRALGTTVEHTVQTLRTPDWRLLGAVGYLAFDIAVLWVCFRAFGHVPPVAALVLGYLIGFLGTIIPVPGASASSTAASSPR